MSTNRKVRLAIGLAVFGIGFGLVASVYIPALKTIKKENVK